MIIFMIFCIACLIVLKQSGKVNNWEMLISIAVLPIFPVFVFVIFGYYIVKFMFVVLFKRWDDDWRE